MRWANFLHIYQPADQQPDILQAIVDQSYRPILSHITTAKDIKLTFNVTGSLLELFDKYGHHDILAMLKKAGEDGKIEFTGSAKYHAFMPLLEEEDVRRQIIANTETCKFYLGDSYKPKGFFPPEMAYAKKFVPVIESMGFEWIILDEIAATGEPGGVDYNKLFKIKGSKLNVFFRERRLSNLIMSSVVRSVDTLRDSMKDDLKSSRYVVTAMDGRMALPHKADNDTRREGF